MLRYVIGFGLCLILTSCWTDQEDTIATGPTACPYEAPKEVPEYKLSTYPDTMGIAIDQEKLTTFMSLASQEAPCYLASNGAIGLTKVPNEDGNANPDFAGFPLASEQSEQNWTNYIEDFKNNLMGLTSVRFTGGESEKITSSSIAIRDDARAWHLWHEYSHALIAQARAENKNQSLYLPTRKFLDSKLDALEMLDPESEEYGVALQKLVQGHRDRIDKSFIDEILIEATLIDLSLQHRDLISVSNEDYFSTMNAIELFMERYDKELRHTRKVFMYLLKKNESIPTNKMTIVRAILYFGDQHRRMAEITVKATSEIEFQ